MIVNNIELYDGKLIHNRFAYKYFRKNVSPYGNIIAFRAPMKVEAEGMIDLEDVIDKDYIASKDAINFCWEIPGLDPFGAVAFQRYFNLNMAFYLKQYLPPGQSFDVRGDDILVVFPEGETHNNFTRGKLSVSITYSNNGVAIGHTGINIDPGSEAPAFAIGLPITDEQVNEVMDKITALFNNIVRDMYTATTKVIV